MTGQGPSRAGRLIKLAGVAALFAATFVVAKTVPATEPRPAPPEPKSALPEVATYGVGYGLALALTIAAFALVHWRLAPPSTALAIVFGLALLQILVHFRCFLHVSLREPARDDLLLVLFSTVIILLMVGGTLVILFNLRTRMM